MSKKGGIYHPALSHLIASAGHSDWITIADVGFPAPMGPERIDLGLTDDIPTVLDVLAAVLAEFHVDRVLTANEATTAAPERIAELRTLLGDIPLVQIDHLEIKRLAQDGRATVKTADMTPYANIIIVSG